ncbi:YihY/virulence factor BrkB family protein [Mitsuaria sp. WAJ17]|uniref:YihY/virulence factor BrkB family protein n=1 Tax=Mitsuaria sp. WAJ17 TaxID=2761452 RepID=UPI001C815E88|nr:YihY/virulence factor BrkB family protein [Mitsuaria sp. WAJ17]
MRGLAGAVWQDFAGAANAWLDDYAPSMGAALSFYTLFSLTPLLLIVISLAGLVFGAPAARAAILAQFGALAGPDIALLLDAMLSSLDRPAAGLLGVALGVLSLLVGATTVFGELQNAMDRIWRIAHQGRGGGWKVLRSRLRALGLVLSLGFLLIVSLLASATLAALRERWDPWAHLWLPLAQGLDFGLSWILVSAMFGMIYKWVPQVQLRWREVLGGAALAALLFTLGKSLIALYIAHSGLASPFGAAGFLVVLLLWVYYAALIFLYGAELTRAGARRRAAQGRPRQPGRPPAPDAPG